MKAIGDTLLKDMVLLFFTFSALPLIPYHSVNKRKSDPRKEKPSMLCHEKKSLAQSAYTNTPEC